MLANGVSLILIPAIGKHHCASVSGAEKNVSRGLTVSNHVLSPEIKSKIEFCVLFLPQKIFAIFFAF